MQFELTKALINEQKAVEEEAMSLGKERYLADLQYKKSHSQEYRMKPLMQVFKTTLGALVTVIQDDIDDYNSPKAGRRKTAIGHAMDIDPPTLAYHTLRNAMGSMDSTATFTQLAVKIGSDIYEERFFREYKDKEQDSYKSAQKVLQKDPTLVRRAGKRRVAKMAAGKGMKMERDRSSEAVIGTWLLECLLRAAPSLFRHYNERVSKAHQARIFAPTEELQQYISRGHDRAALFNPDFMPMVIPPRSWSTHNDGGYITPVADLAEFETLINRLLDPSQLQEVTG